MELDLTCVVVTSPTRANPALGLLPQVIASFELVRGLDTCAGGVIIVGDGFVVSSNTQTKRGRVSPRTAVNYELYWEELCRTYTAPRYRLIRCPQHRGFAHAVKTGLEEVSTTFALIAQHDRAFIEPFELLPQLLDTMTRYEWVRYVGFPSVMNRQHANLLHCQYGLKELAAPASRIPIDLDAGREQSGKTGATESSVRPVVAGDGATTSLMPLIFWYDSQHVCHVQRYLRIFDAPADVPTHLKDLLGPDLIWSMRLRRGDFIEDRFGQAQKKMMTAEPIRNDTERMQELFRYFGSYLLWESQTQAGEMVGGRARAFVGHLRGRQQFGGRQQVESLDAGDTEADTSSEAEKDGRRSRGWSEFGCLESSSNLKRDERTGISRRPPVGLCAAERQDRDDKEREWLADIASYLRAQSRCAPLRLTQIASSSGVPRPAGVKEKLVKLVKRRGHEFGLAVAGQGCELAVSLVSKNTLAVECETLQSDAGESDVAPGEAKELEVP